jgi:dihydroorotate dehydrogenase
MMVARYAEKSERVLDQIREACYVEGEEKLKTDIWGLEFPNPVWLAAGFAKAPHWLKLWEAFWFGSISIWGVTLHAQSGNERQRIFRPSPEDVVNGMWLPWNGLNETISMLADRKYEWMYPQVPIWANLCNSEITKPEDKIDECKQMMLALYSYVDYFEINISCPNQAGVCGLSQQLEVILKELTTYNDVLAYTFWKKNKLFVKISPLTINPDNPVDGTEEWLETLAGICNKYADDWVHAVIATNTAQEHEYKDQTQIKKPNWDTITWGASGKQIQERSRETASKLRPILDSQIPIIWVWWIWYDEEWQEWQSAVNMLDSWATSIQLYSSFVQNSVLSVKDTKEAILEVRS